MCGRFYVDDETAREIERVIRQVNDRVNGVPTGDIYPTNPAAVLSAQNNEIAVTLKRWGFPNYRSKNVIINARAESVLEKKLFHDSILKRRLIIPAGGFYEWNPAKEKVTFSPLPSPNVQAPILFMAGFYNHFEEEDRFVILTTAANESMKGIHDRMPLTLEPYELKDWLFDDHSLEKFLHKTPGLLNKRQEYLQQTFPFFDSKA